MFEKIRYLLKVNKNNSDDKTKKYMKSELIQIMIYLQKNASISTAKRIRKNIFLYSITLNNEANKFAGKEYPEKKVKEYVRHQYYTFQNVAMQVGEEKISFWVDSVFCSF